MVKRVFKDGEVVIAVECGRLYKAKVLKGVALRSSWKYFVHYELWAIKYDKWVDEDCLRVFCDKLKGIKWGIHGHPLSKLSNLDEKKKTLDETATDVKKESDDSAATSENHNPAQAKKDTNGGKRALLESEEQEKKRRKGYLLKNLRVEEPVVLSGGAEDAGPAVSSGGPAKVTIAIPVYLKKMLVDDWSNISVETCIPPPKMLLGDSGVVNVAPYSKLIQLPRQPSVSAIINMFLEAKHASLFGVNGTAAADEGAVAVYQNCYDVLMGLKNYFNQALPVVLLYRQEREQLEIIRSRYVEHNKTSESKLTFSPASVYGAEHLVRLMVRLPQYIESSLLGSLIQEQNKMIMRINELLKFILKNSSQCLGQGNTAMTAGNTSSNSSGNGNSSCGSGESPAVVDPIYDRAEDVLEQLKHWDPKSLEVSSLKPNCLPSNTTAGSGSALPASKAGKHSPAVTKPDKKSKNPSGGSGKARRN